MLVKRLLVLMLATAFLTLSFGCAKKAVVDEPIGDPIDPPPIEEPVEEPDTSGDTGGEDVSMINLEDVFFDFDKYNLSAESKRTLERNADELKRYSGVTIRLEGHCDERGTKSYNLALGEKRANAARDYLVALGVSESRIKVVSYGKERPFAMGHNEEAWAKNRRAHVVIVN